MSDAILEKISKILHQAERASTPGEAEVFFHRAQTIATKYAIDIAVARAHSTGPTRENPTSEIIDMGKAGAKQNAQFVNLFLTIANANDLKLNAARNSTYVIAFGFPSDIAITKTLYTNIVLQMVSAANKYLATGEYKKERYWSENTYSYRPMDGRIARRSFYNAFILKIGQRLQEAKRQAEAEAKQESANAEHVQTESSSTALVLASKHVEIENFYKEKSTAKGSWRGGKGSGTSSHARAAGTEAGARARLGQTSLGGSAKGIER